MTVRAYSCNCGWVDLGHADSASRRPHVGAQNLWGEVSQPRETRQFVPVSELRAVEADRNKVSAGASTAGAEFTGYRVT